VLKPEVFKQKRDELQKKLVELNETYMKLERELAGDRTKLIQDLLKQAEPVIKKLAAKEGVHLIIDQSATVWADPAVDLTPALNAEMK
jgi:Skp family chaperone for outer membrane proteins